MRQSPPWRHLPALPALLLHSPLPVASRPASGRPGGVGEGGARGRAAPLSPANAAGWPGLLLLNQDALSLALGASVMTRRHQESFKVTLCYTLVPLSQTLSFYLKYRKVVKCVGSGAWYWLATMGPSSDALDRSSLRKAGAVAFSLEGAVKTELLLTGRAAHSKPAVSGSSGLRAPEGPRRVPCSC